MDDGDGAFVLELMGGNPALALHTIYNGTTACTNCGLYLDPATSLFGGGLCPPCNTHRATRLVKNRMVSQ